MKESTNLKSTPLLNEHLRLGAKMATFAGWNMPIQYEGIIAEHNHTRRQVSLFDVCHMGELYINGDPIKTGLDRLFSFSIQDMPVGRCRYGAMLNEKGGIIDDLIVYRISKNEWMVVVNAGTIDKDARHMTSSLKKGTEFENRSERIAKLDLQGPLSRQILAEVMTPEIERLRYFTFDYFDILGEKSIISRTGYTGELGYELYISAEKASELWNYLLKERRIRPAGLGARDTLRLEMGYTLYDHDVDEETTPLEANLVKFINFDRGFIGKETLTRQKKDGIKRLLVAFKTDSRRAPRHGYVINKNGRKIGSVTSGSFSPSLACGIGLGYVEIKYARLGEKIIMKSDSLEIEAVITEKPFYRQSSLKT